MWSNPQEAETVDLVTFAEEIRNGKLYFLYCDGIGFPYVFPSSDVSRVFLGVPNWAGGFRSAVTPPETTRI